MVTKQTTVEDHWVCKTCGSWYNDKDKAEACENKGFVKVKIGPCGCSTDQWKIGDLAVVHIHDQRDHLGMIVGERKEERFRRSHDIIPIWLFIDIGMRNHDTWNYEEVVWVDDATKRRIKRWAKLLDEAVKIRRKELGRVVRLSSTKKVIHK